MFFKNKKSSACILKCWVFTLTVKLGFCLTTTTTTTTECVTELDDYLISHWQSLTKVSYILNSESLPRSLRGKPGLESENGILYFQGSHFLDIHSLLQPSKIFVNGSDNEGGAIPSYIYIRYYAHVKKIRNQVAYIMPILRADGDTLQVLQITSDFRWREEYFQLQLDSLVTGMNDQIEITLIDFSAGDYFLIDKIVIVQGINISDISQFSSYCNREMATDDESTTTRPG